MKITPKILHLPPYLSTSWAQVSALYVKEGKLVVSLKDGTQVHIPGLANDLLEAIFSAHAAFIENQQRHSEKQSPIQFIQASMPETDGQSLRFNFENLDSFQSAMQHNPSQAGMPDLPKEILTKIAAIARAVAPEDIASIPKPEPHCNCMHCQIAKAILERFDQEGKPQEEKITLADSIEQEEEISEADLGFQQWEIVQSGEKLYTVINRLDTQEKYSVYLGHPVGCTCGKQGCEHVLAVLKS